ncbi:MAG: PAS domain S-box protein, partial [Rhodocyclaceae bacterium]
MDKNGTQSAASGSREETTSIHYLVGMGASVGGLDALRHIIPLLEKHGVATFIVAQHALPTQANPLPQLLEKDAKLTITAAEDGAALTPDCVFVIPPGCDATVKDGRLCLTPEQPGIHGLPRVDELFRSLAQSHGRHAIGVVLSGTGSDGAAGAEAIHAAGGTVLVQEPGEATAPDMPEAVIRAGAADLQLTTEEIAFYLNALVPVLEAGAPTQPALDDDEDFRSLLDLVFEATRLDVTQYKEATLRRQIERRLKALALDGMAAYLAHVRDHAAELALLRQQFLISVTEFFRDCRPFEALETALRELVARKRRGDSVRVWVTGCATGEEAYSVAILLQEILGPRLDQFEVKIFATDIDEEAVQFARRGLYSARAMEGVSAARRARFFSSENGGYRISQGVREMCVFSPHDLIVHPPFIRMDAVICRNLLIYFKPSLQERVFSHLHFALNSDGYLLLGRSESVGPTSRLFEAVDAENKLFRRKSLPTQYPAYPVRRPPAAIPVRPRIDPPDNETGSLVASALNRLAGEYAPASVLVDTNFRVLHFFGNVRRYLALGEGSADFSLFALCLPELRDELKILCYRMLRPDLSEARGLPARMTLDGSAVFVQLTIRHVPQEQNGAAPALLISFEEMPADPPASGATANPDGYPDTAAEEIGRLRRELETTRSHLQAVIEELESSNEELQALNEEMQASSEELQSSNEELQASNEELTTLADELRAKSAELARSNTALTNVQESMRSALVVVDRLGRVTRFNSQAVRIFGLVKEDIGQTLDNVPSHLPLPRLRDQISRASETGAVVVEPVREGDQHYLMQVAPYVDETGERSGAILTFADVSELRRTELARQDAQARFDAFMLAVPAIAWIKDEEGRHVYLNGPYLERLGIGPEDSLGKTDFDLWPTETAESCRQSDLEVINTGQPHQHAEEAIAADGTRTWWLISKFAFRDASGRCLLGGIGLDVTQSKQIECALRANEQRLRLALDAAQAGTWEWNLGNNENTWSDEMWPLYGIAPRSCLPSYEAWRATVHPDDRARVEQTIGAAVARGQEFETDWRVNAPPDTPPRWLLSRGSPLVGDDGKATRYLGIVMDITVRQRIAEALQASEDRFRTLFEKMEEGFFLLEAILGDAGRPVDWRFLDVNPAHEKLLGVKREEVVGHTISELYPALDAFWLDAYAHTAMTGESLRREGIVSASGRYYESSMYAPRHGQVAVVYSDTTERVAAQKARQESEGRFRALVEQAADALVVCSEDGRIIDVNRRTCESLGYTREELLQLYLPDIDVAYDLSRAQATWHEIRRGEPFTALGQHRRKDGTVFPVEISLGVFERDGERSYVGLVRDISDRLRAEQELRVSERRFHDIANVSGDWVWETNAEGRFTYLSENLTEVLGYDPGELLGKRPFDIIPAEDGERVRVSEHIAAMSARREAFRDVEHSVLHKDGSLRHVVVNGTPILDGQGNLLGYRGQDKDITERKSIENELARYRFHLEELVASRTAELAEAQQRAEAANKAKS